MQESFWWRQGSDRYIISLFSYIRPSLISLMVFVEVKHHERKKERAKKVDFHFTIIIII